MIHSLSFTIKRYLIVSAVVLALVSFSSAHASPDTGARLGAQASCMVYKKALRVPGACQAGKAAYRAGEKVRDALGAAGRRVGKKLYEYRCRDGKGYNCR